MTTLSQDIKEKLSRLHILEKIIVANTMVFVAGIFLNLIGFNLLEWFSLPYILSDFFGRPWSILSYGFLHKSISHLFFNMLVLYFIAQTFSNLFSARLSLKIYLLGVIYGGLAFIIVAFCCRIHYKLTDLWLVLQQVFERVLFFCVCIYQINPLAFSHFDFH